MKKIVKNPAESGIANIFKQIRVVVKNANEDKKLSGLMPEEISRIFVPSAEFKLYSESISGYKTAAAFPMSDNNVVRSIWINAP